MPANDKFQSFSVPLSGPISNLANVVPNNSTDLSDVTRAIYVGTGGDVTVVTDGGQTLTIALGAGWHPLRVTRIRANGTTATGIVAGW